MKNYDSKIIYSHHCLKYTVKYLYFGEFYNQHYFNNKDLTQGIVQILHVIRIKKQ